MQNNQLQGYKEPIYQDSQKKEKEKESDKLYLKNLEKLTGDDYYGEKLGF